MVERSKIRKDYQLAVRLKEDEYNVARAVSSEVGISFSSWCRELILRELRAQADQGDVHAVKLFKE